MNSEKEKEKRKKENRRRDSGFVKLCQWGLGGTLRSPMILAVAVLPLWEPASALAAPMQFTDVTEQSGIDFQFVGSLRLRYHNSASNNQCAVCKT